MAKLMANLMELSEYHPKVVATKGSGVQQSSPTTN